jgi:hypothetical protein
LAVELPPEVSGEGSLTPVDLTCGAGATCDVKTQTLLDPKTITVQQQIIDDSLKKQAERWQILKDTQTKIFDITKDATLNKKNSADALKGQTRFNGYIYGSTDSTDTVALQATDAELTSVFPGSGPSLNSVSTKRATAAAMPPADLVLRALSEPAPSRTQLRALEQALALANGPEYSTDRAVARITLTNGLVLGQRLLAAQGASFARGGPIVIGTSTATVPGGRSKRVAVDASALGERALRLVDVARGGAPVTMTVTIDLSRSGSRKHASRTIPLG